MATTDKSLPSLLSALLEPTGFEVQTIPACNAHDVQGKEFVILVLDGDLHFSVDCGLPAVVVISQSDAVDAYDKGADLVVDKPLVANVLMAKIRAVLRRYGVKV